MSGTTRTHDLDRRLAGFLQDGPTRSTDRPIDAALAHARAHPRQRDPLAVLRRDPMATPMLGWTFRPALVLALVAMLLAVGAAVYVGSRGNESVTPPIPSPSVTLAPSLAPIRLSADIVDGTGTSKVVSVVDFSRTLLSARGGEASSNPPIDFEATNPVADRGVVQLRWTDLGCPAPYELSIAADGRTFTLDRPFTNCDLLPIDHVLVLTFAGPVPAGEIVWQFEQPTEP